MKFVFFVSYLQSSGRLLKAVYVSTWATDGEKTRHRSELGHRSAGLKQGISHKSIRMCPRCTPGQASTAIERAVCKSAARLRIEGLGYQPAPSAARQHARTNHMHKAHARHTHAGTQAAHTQCKQSARACASTHTDMRRAHRCSACSGRGRRGPWGSRLSRSARGTGVNRAVQIKLAYICHMGMCIWDDCQVLKMVEEDSESRTVGTGKQAAQWCLQRLASPGAAASGPQSYTHRSGAPARLRTFRSGG